MATPTTTPPDSRCSVPVVRSSVIERPRMQERLHASIGNGLIVLQAPAGFAKSTELSIFVSQVDYAVAWVSLDSGAQNAAVFAQELATAILGEAAWRPERVEKAEDLRAYLTAVFREFARSTDSPLLLVIDNAHELNGAPPACDVLAWLVDTIPAGYEIVLAGREPLPIPAIDRRVAAGEAAFLAADDLAFTLEEVQALCEMRGSGIEPAAAHEATRGWPIALAGILSGTISLAAGSAKGTAPGAWDRYLESDVWAAVPPGLREPLLLTSIAPALERDAALNLIDAATWDRLRRWLEQRGFLSELVSSHAIRLNPSFQRFLRNEATAADYDRAADAVTKIVLWLERTGRIEDAIQVSIDMDMPAVLAGTLERHANALMMRGAAALLHRAFELVPPVHIPVESPLNAIRLRVLAHVGFAEAALDQVAALLRRPLDPTTRFHALLARIRCLRALGAIGDLNQLFRETRAVVDGTEPALLAEYYFLEAQNCIYFTADYERAARLLNECQSLAETAGAMHLALMAQSAHGELLSLMGDSPRAVDKLAQAASGWRRMRGVGNLCWVLNNLAMAHLGVGDTVSARAALEEAQREAEAIENERGEAFAIASLGDVMLAAGDFEKAKEYYAEALRRTADSVLDLTLAIYTLIGLSATELALGDVVQADFLAARASEMALRGGSPQDVAAADLQLAATFSAAGEHEKAEACALRALEVTTDIGASNARRAARLRLALARFRGGRKAEAEDALAGLAADITSPWMLGALRPTLRLDPMFAQWAASRARLPEAFRMEVTRQLAIEPETFEPPTGADDLPRVEARSLGAVSVSVGGVPLSERDWATARARELFFVFLANPDGLRKHEAVLSMYPDLPESRCNSAFHSNLYRLRRALYHDCVVVEEGIYRLNPAGEFEWDVRTFREQLARAANLPAGSAERTQAMEKALALYNGPFAKEFYSEWAETVREETERSRLQAVSAVAGFYAGRGDYLAAAHHLGQVLAANPYNDEAAHELARYQALAGNSVVAIGLIDDFARRYDAELGQPLPPRLRNLRAAIATGRAV